MPVQPTGQCDQGSCAAFAQVSIQTRAGPLGFCAHHYDTNFAALVVRGCDHARRIGDLKPPRWIGTHHQQEPRSDPDHQAREGYPEATHGLFAEDSPGRKRVMRRLTYLAGQRPPGPWPSSRWPWPAPPAAATTAAGAVGSHGTQNWAGYVETMKTPGGDKGEDRFKRVEATFTVPHVSCAKSILYTQSQYQPWSATSMWVGFDGEQGSTAIEQAGIQATCASRTAAAKYTVFYQVVTTDNVTPSFTVKPGDVVTASVEDSTDLAPGASPGPNFGNPAKAGYYYTLSVQDVTRGTTWTKYNAKVPNRAPDAQAEIITEAESNGPFYPHPAAIGLADMGTVTYTDASVASLATGWIYGIQLMPTEYWTLTKDSLTLPQNLIGTTALSDADSSFSTYWK